MRSYDTNPETILNLLIRENYSSNDDTDDGRNTKILALVIKNNECYSSDKSNYAELNKIEEKRTKL